MPDDRLEISEPQAVSFSTDWNVHWLRDLYMRAGVEPHLVPPGALTTRAAVRPLTYSSQVPGKVLG